MATETWPGHEIGTNFGWVQKFVAFKYQQTFGSNTSLFERNFTQENQDKSGKKKVNKLDDRIRRSRLSLRRKTRWISCLSFSYLCLTCVPPDDRGVTDLEPDRPAPTLVEEADWTCKGIRERGLKYLWRNRFSVKI